MNYESQLEVVRDQMSGEPSTKQEKAENQIANRVNSLISEMDELCLMANNPETRDLIAREAIGIGQIQFRASLILSFLSDVPKLRVVS